MSDCLSMRGVWKSYDAGVRGCSATVSVLRDVHLDVSRGEMVGITAAPARQDDTPHVRGRLLCADRGYRRGSADRRVATPVHARRA